MEQRTNSSASLHSVQNQTFLEKDEEGRFIVYDASDEDTYYLAKKCLHTYRHKLKIDLYADNHRSYSYARGYHNPAYLQNTEPYLSKVMLWIENPGQISKVTLVYPSFELHPPAESYAKAFNREAVMDTRLLSTTNTKIIPYVASSGRPFQNDEEMEFILTNDKPKNAATKEVPGFLIQSHVFTSETGPGQGIITATKIKSSKAKVLDIDVALALDYPTFKPTEEVNTDWYGSRWDPVKPYRALWSCGQIYVLWVDCLKRPRLWSKTDNCYNLPETAVAYCQNPEKDYLPVGRLIKEVSDVKLLQNFFELAPKLSLSEKAMNF